MSPGPAGTFPAFKFGLSSRLGATALLLAAEFVTVTIAIDTQALAGLPGILGWAAAWGAWGLKTVLLACVLSIVLGLSRLRAPRCESNTVPVRTDWLGSAIVQILSFAAFWVSSAFLVGGSGLARSLAAILAPITGILTLVSGALVWLPAAFWKQLFQAAPYALLAGPAIAVGTLAAFKASAGFAEPWLRFTFACTHAVLKLVAHPVVADPARMLLGTPDFQVVIAPACSGYEGVALMLVFGGAWLWLFRREFRFPRALFLIPAGMAAMWVVNCLRLVALILIGSAGAPNIAAGGFHSQAGWIGFLTTAVAFTLASQRVAWFRAHAPTVSRPAAAAADGTAAYLVPFLAILAAGMAAQAASAGFEWLYPLRVLACAAALGYYRRSYQDLDWRGGGHAVITGALVFAVWMFADRMLPAAASPAGFPEAFTSAPLLQRTLWLMFRVAGAVMTVPVAEELAFRGYLLRRLISSAFESVPCSRFTWLSFTMSSVVFGAMHGRLWLPGVLAGAAYAWAFQRRGRIGDAILAHATTNGMLALWVAATGAWRLW